MTQQERLKLARATSRSDFAHLLDERNVAGRTVSLREAVRSGQSYFVTPRRDLLVVDVDLPDDPRDASDVLASFDLLIDAARRADVAHVALDSGRAGHRHGYFVVGTGSHRVRLERWCRERGLDVRDRGIRPPGTPHRLGATTGWDPSVDCARVLRALNADVVLEASERLTNQLCPVVLPARVLTAVRCGHERAGYASASHARMALAVGVRARGGGAGLLEAILRDPGSPLGATFRAKDPGWQRAEIKRVWEKAGDWIARGGRPAPLEKLRNIYGAASAWAWRGAAGGSDLAVLEELIRSAAAVPTLVVGASLGDVAAGAGVSVDTARAALRRLERAGWVRVVSHESARTSRTYALLIAPGAHADPSFDWGVPGRDDFGDLGADVARRGGLGKVTVRVAREVARAGLRDVAALADALSMSAVTVRYHVRKLVEAGLLLKDGNTLTLTATPERVDDLAARRGVLGARGRALEVLASRRALRASARETFAKLWQAARAARSGVAAPPHPAAAT